MFNHTAPLPPPFEVRTQGGTKVRYERDGTWEVPNQRTYERRALATELRHLRHLVAVGCLEPPKIRFDDEAGGDVPE